MVCFLKYDFMILAELYVGSSSSSLNCDI
jgi:hypothetical protein